LLIVVCAPAIAVATGVFVATTTALPSYHPAENFVGNVRLKKLSQDHGLRNLDTTSVLEDPHSNIDLLLMHGIVL
jgi:hypothetical protein